MPIRNTKGGKGPVRSLIPGRSGKTVAVFALLFLVAVSSSMILNSDEEVSAADEVIDGINYTLYPSTSKATVISGGYTGSITIPATVPSGGKDYTVTNIATTAFRDNTSVTSVTIGTNVTAIGDNAFSGCTGLTTVTFNETSSVKTIHTYAFSGCISLTTINIPSQVTTIQYNAFSGCTSLKEITIPSQVTLMQNDVFSGCIKLMTVEFEEGSSLATLSSSTFKDCISLTTINIPDSVTTIGTYAFSGCTSLTSITIPSLVEIMDSYAFLGCTNLSSVSFEGSSLTSLSQQVFKNCSSLKSIKIPSSVKTMGSDVFSGCKILETVVFETPASLTKIGYSAFSGTNLGSIIIPKTVAAIDKYAFKDCTNLTSVEFESGSLLKTIDVNSFTDCTGLKSITIPSSVTIISAQAFQGCTSLMLVTFEESSKLKTLEYNAFSGCYSIVSIKIPKSVTSIGNYAFSGCSGMTELEFEASSSLTSIGDYAFSGCSGIKSVAIPDSVTTIGKTAFNACSNLATVTIPNSVTNIGDSIFYVCPIDTLIITYSSKSNTSAILGASFDWKRQGTGGEISTLIIDAPNMSIPDIKDKTGKTIIFTDKAVATAEGSFYGPDGSELKGSERADKKFVYDDVTKSWIAITHTVTFEVNGGTAVPDGKVFDGYQAIRPADPTKYDHTLEGWFQDSDLTAAYDFSMPVTSDITLYAKWAIKQYAVTFDGNGGTGTGTAIEDYLGAIVTVPAYEFTRAGYTQNGWNTAADGTGTSRSAGDTFPMPSGGMTLYAAWTALDYAITFNLNGGTAVSDIATDLTGFTGSEIDIADLLGGSKVIKTGYKSPAWTISGVTITGGKFIMPANDIEIVAGWTYAEYTITFDSAGGSAVASMTQRYGTAVTATTDPVREGHTFAGWSKILPSTMPAHDLAATAVWNINQYTVTVTSEENVRFSYVADGNDPVEFTAGPNGSYGISVLYGSVLVIQAMPGEGYQFRWTYTGASTDGNIPTINIGAPADGNVTAIDVTDDGNVLTINVTSDGTVGGRLSEDSTASSDYTQYITFAAAAVAAILLFAVGRMISRP